MANSLHVFPGVSSVGRGVMLLQENWEGDRVLGNWGLVVETPWLSKVSRQKPRSFIVAWANFFEHQDRRLWKSGTSEMRKMDVVTVKTWVLTNAERSWARLTGGGRSFCVRRSAAPLSPHLFHPRRKSQTHKIVAVGCVFIEKKLFRGLIMVDNIEHTIVVNKSVQGRKPGLGVIQALTAIATRWDITRLEVFQTEIVERWKKISGPRTNQP